MRKLVTFGIVVGLTLPASPSFSQDVPKISDGAYCASVYGALARAKSRRSKSPKDLITKPGFLSIDFAARQKKVQAKFPKETAAIVWHQQVLEEAFDQGGYAEADGKPVPESTSTAMSHAVIKARECDRDNAFEPAILDRLALKPAPPVEPWSCGVNYLALGLGMRDPNQQKAVMARTQAMMARFDPGMQDDSVWRDRLRVQIRADAQERNKAVGARQVTPEQLFSFAQSCDRLLGAPAGT